MPPRISGAVPLLGHAAEFIRDPVGLVERGHREAGEIFSLRLGTRNVVVLLGPERTKFFFSETGRRLSIREGYPFFKRMFDPEFYFFAGADEYRKQRDIMLPRFRGKELDSYMPAMEHEVAAFERELGAAGEIDLIPELGPLVMRIAARAFLGADFGARMTREFFADFRRFSEGMDPVLPPWLPTLRQLRSRGAKRRLHRVLRLMIHERRRSTVATPDFLQTLAEARYADGEPVPDSVLVNMILLFTWAGHETTAGHLAWAIADLLGAPDELDRVVAERDEVLGVRKGPLDVATVRRLRHLDNCLQETERLHPVAFMLARKATAAIRIDDYVIPSGTMVLVVPSVTHRLVAHFRAPNRFWPDRFADGDAGRAERQHLAGFGGGLHRCLGIHFAYLEMKLVLARLLGKYELELLDQAPRPVSGTRTKWPASPCRVRYRLKVRDPIASG